MIDYDSDRKTSKNNGYTTVQGQLNELHAPFIALAKRTNLTQSELLRTLVRYGLKAQATEDNQPKELQTIYQELKIQELKEETPPKEIQ